MTLPTVSIVMPCFNTLPAFIEEAVDSAFQQTYAETEIIIIDDGSTDPTTREYLDQIDDARITKLRQRNGGPSAARNHGVRNSNGAYILPLDADDRIAKDYIAHAVAVLDEQPDVGIVYGEGVYFGAASGRMNLPDPTPARMLIENGIFNSAVFRRSDFDAVAGYNERLKHGFEDHELWLKILFSGKKTFKLDEIVYYYRIQEASRNSSVLQDRDRFVATRAEFFRANVNLFAQYPEAMFEELESMRARVSWWEQRYGPAERLINAVPGLPWADRNFRRLFERLRRR